MGDSSILLFDVFGEPAADPYLTIMRTGKPVVNQPWLVADHRGTLKWHLTSKVPLFGDGGKAIGVAGALRDIEEASALSEPFRELDAAG